MKFENFRMILRHMKAGIDQAGAYTAIMGIIWAVFGLVILLSPHSLLEFARQGSGRNFVILPIFMYGLPIFLPILWFVIGKVSETAKLDE